jgi:hypothetical protein
MESKGIVSLWIGRADSRRALDAALKVAFDEDGEFLGSMLGRAPGVAGSGCLPALHRCRAIRVDAQSSHCVYAVARAQRTRPVNRMRA